MIPHCRGIVGDNMTTENFKEVCTVKEANEVDMTIYRFERFSETRGSWLFVKRTR